MGFRLWTSPTTETTPKRSAKKTDFFGAKPGAKELVSNAQQKRSHHVPPCERDTSLTIKRLFCLLAIVAQEKRSRYTEKLSTLDFHESGTASGKEPRRKSRETQLQVPRLRRHARLKSKTLSTASTPLTPTIRILISTRGPHKGIFLATLRTTGPICNTDDAQLARTVGGRQHFLILCCAENAMWEVGDFVVALVLRWAVHDHHADLATIIGKDANDVRVVIHKVRRELFSFDGLFSRSLVVRRSRVCHRLRNSLPCYLLLS